VGTEASNSAAEKAEDPDISLARYLNGPERLNVDVGEGDLVDLTIKPVGGASIGETVDGRLSHLYA
jgi:hypothetical protein